MSEIKEILSNLGYQLKEDNGGWRSAAIYRNGDNSTALKIFPDGRWIDFVESSTGNFEELIKLSLGLKDIKESQSWLKNRNFDFESIILSDKPKLKIPKYYKTEELNNLEPDHSYWINRGISAEVLEKFRGGVWKGEGKLKGRYCFPIFRDSKEDKIVGWAGRSLDKNSKLKWKLIGNKNAWTNFGNNYKSILDTKQVILVESSGDAISLVQSNFKNVLLLYGIELSNEKLTYLIRLNPSKIIISLNNDSAKNNAGNIAAEKVKTRLKRYFDEQKLEIRLPNIDNCKDFNEILVKYGSDKIREFFNN
jgi:hypothetical protein